MEISQTLYVTTRKEWRAWLSKHFRTEKDIWLVYYKKDSGRPRIPYGDAVEEALCFGWIDSTIKKIDADRFAQRFSPRKPQSTYSQSNRARLQKLIAQKKVRPEVIAAFKKSAPAGFLFPPDILAAIRKNPDAWRNFQKWSKSYREIRAAYIEGARNRPEEFQRRLQNLIKTAAQGRQIGFGGIQKYY